MGGIFLSIHSHFHLCSPASTLHTVLRCLSHAVCRPSNPGHSNPSLPALRPKPQNSALLCPRASLSRFLPSRPSKCPELDHPQPAPHSGVGPLAPGQMAPLLLQVFQIPCHVSARTGVLIAATTLWLPSLCLRHTNLHAAFRATQKLLPL